VPDSELLTAPAAGSNEEITAAAPPIFKKLRLLVPLTSNIIIPPEIPPPNTDRDSPAPRRTVLEHRIGTAFHCATAAMISKPADYSLPFRSLLRYPVEE
jgi:hypothetical protein